jgi:hypothetical protein
MLIRLKLIHPNRQKKVQPSGVGVVADVELGVFASNHLAGEEVRVDLEDPMRDLYLFRSC